MKDYYDILKVPFDASPQEIHKAFRSLAFSYHPDFIGGLSSENFIELREAYETLRKEKERDQYDKWWWKSRASLKDQPQNLDASQNTLTLPEVVSKKIQEAILVEDNYTFAKDDVVLRFEIPLETSLKPHFQRLKLPEYDHTYLVRTPGKLWHGSKLLVKGLGKVLGKSNLILNISLATHPHFRVVGHNIYSDLLVAPWELALGAKKKLRTLEGYEVVQLSSNGIPKGITRLEKKGLYNAKGDIGDHWITLKLHFPSVKSAHIQDLWQQLAKAHES